MILEFLEALLGEKRQIDEGAVGRPIDLVVAVQDVRPKEVQGLLHDVVLPWGSKKERNEGMEQETGLQTTPY